MDPKHYAAAQRLARRPSSEHRFNEAMDVLHPLRAPDRLQLLQQLLINGALDLAGELISKRAEVFGPELVLGIDPLTLASENSLPTALVRVRAWFGRHHRHPELDDVIYKALMRWVSRPGTGVRGEPVAEVRQPSTNSFLFFRWCRVWPHPGDAAGSPGPIAPGRFRTGPRPIWSP